MSLNPVSRYGDSEIHTHRLASSLDAKARPAFSTKAQALVQKTVPT